MRSTIGKASGLVLAFLFGIIAFIAFFLFPAVMATLNPNAEFPAVIYIYSFWLHSPVWLQGIPPQVAEYIILSAYSFALAFLIYICFRKRDLLAYYGFAFFMYSMLLMISYAISPGPKTAPIPSPSSEASKFLKAIYQLVFAPLWEEFHFRFLIVGVPLFFYALYKKRPLWYIFGKIKEEDFKFAWPFILISGAIFGYMHRLGGWGWYKVFPTMFIGGCLAYFYARYGFHTSIFFHFTVNVISAITGYSVATKNLGMSFLIGISSGILSYIGMAFAILFLVSFAFRGVPLGRLKFIGITGPPGSGKTTSVRILEKYGCKSITMGDVVREEAKRRGIPLEAEQLTKFAGEMREKHGKGIWAIKTLEKIREMARKGDVGNGIIVIDGIRNPEEVEFFREYLVRKGSRFLLIKVDAPAEIRYQRMLERGRPDEIKSFEEFMEREKEEMSWGLAQVMEMADINIQNTGTIEDLERILVEILWKVL